MVTGFNGFDVGSYVRAQVSLGSFGFAWIHSCAPKGRRVHSDAHPCASQSLWVHGFTRCARGRGVHSGSRGFILAHLGVVGFIRVCVS